MTRLSLETRALRRANRRNKKVLQRNPLLAAEILDGSLQHWLTTPTVERAKLEEIDVRTASMFARLSTLASTHARQAAQLRALVAAHVPPEQLAAWDERRLAYPNNPVYAVGFWFEKLKQLAPAEAHRCCANKAMHESFRAWYDRCPCCGMPLERRPQVEQEMMEIL